MAKVELICRNLALILMIIWIIVQQTSVTKPVSKIHFIVVFIIMLIFDYMFYLDMNDLLGGKL